MQQVYTKGFLLERSLYKFKAFFFHYTNDCATLFFLYLPAKEYYRLFEFLRGLSIKHLRSKVGRGEEVKRKAYIYCFLTSFYCLWAYKEGGSVWKSSGFRVHNLCMVPNDKMEHLKYLKQSFKIFEPDVLKVRSFKRWNETVIQHFCNTNLLSEILCLETSLY